MFCYVLVSLGVDEHEYAKSTKREKWNLWKTFHNEKECREFIKSLLMWSVRKHNETAAYTVVYYRCNLVPLNGETCEAQLKLFIYKNEIKEEIYINNKDHTHDNIKQIKISEETKAKILNMHSEGISSNQIAHVLEEKLTTKQILNVIGNERKKSGASGEIDMATIRNWLESQSKIPERDDEPYVAKFETSKFNEPQFIRFVYTSRKLMRNINISKLVCADTTFKLTTLNLPLYVVGTIDEAKHFHYIAIGSCTSEQTADFKFIFSGIKEAAAQLGIDMRPEVFLSDGSMPMINAFYETFETSIVTNNMCQVHVMRNAEQHLKASEMSIGNKKQKSKIIDSFRNDFVVLQTAPTTAKFDVAWRLFKDKYNRISESFTEYFEKQWLKKPRLSNWYEGANKYVKNNNALESSNKVIKQNYIRSKLPFDLFTQRLSVLITDYSQSYEINRIVHTTPEITDGMWKLMAYINQKKFIKECAKKTNSNIQIF